MPDEAEDGHDTIRAKEHRRKNDLPGEMNRQTTLVNFRTTDDCTIPILESSPAETSSSSTRPIVQETAKLNEKPSTSPAENLQPDHIDFSSSSATQNQTQALTQDMAATLSRSSYSYGHHLRSDACEACNFKDGQIFALVQILHSFHRGELGRKTRRAESQTIKKIHKPTVLSSLPRAGRQRSCPTPKQTPGQVSQVAEQKEPDITQPSSRTRSGRVSKATIKILQAGNQK